jgi:hypothetical protein
VISVVVVGVAVAAVVRWMRAGRVGGRDRDRRHRGSRLLLATAARLFPPERREWARAMLAELDEIPGSFARWRFALGGVRAGLVASGRGPVPVARMAVVVAVAAGVGAVVYVVSPVTHVFAIALAIVLTLAGISWPRRRADGATSGAALGVTLLTGVAACVALTLFGVAAYPAAAGDDGGTTAYSLVLASALGAYVWVGLAAWRADRHDHTSLAAGPVLGGLLIGAGYAVVGVVADHFGLLALVAVGGVAGLLAAGAFGARLVRRRTTERGLVAAGLRVGLVAALAYFVAAMSATYVTASWPVHDREALDAFRASGLPDLATYLVSDALGGAIAALIGLPVLVLGAVWAGGALVRAGVGDVGGDAVG